MSARSLLELNDVTVAFGGSIGGKPPFVALENLNLVIPADKPRIIAIAGESGSGKTTLGRVALGLTKPTGGAARFEGTDIWRSGAIKTAAFRRAVQAVFQDPFSVFNPFYPVDHLLRMPLARFGIAKDRAQQEELMADALRQVGLKPDQVIGRYPHQLSGGQRQRVVVARALMLKPRLIIADEPVSMIDASLRATVLENLRALRDEQGISILYITHDLATARQVSDQLYVLYRGRAVEIGDAGAVITRPQHPYTQLLMSSIPRPDPDTPWPAGTARAEQAIVSDRSACVFIDRCPRRMDVCRVRPPYFRTEPGRDVACYLHGDKPAEQQPAEAARELSGANLITAPDTTVTRN